MRLARRWGPFAAIAVVTMIADQATKRWALAALPTEGGRGVAVPVIEGYWDWRLSYNMGSAFGLFHGASGARIFLTVVAIVALGVLVWMVKKARDDQRLLLVGLGLVAGGAVGNLIDRVLAGKVTDFVVWKVGTHEWPTFNVADAALCVGVGLMLLAGDGKPRATPTPRTAGVPRR